ncbi:MAG: hypothetical protein QGG36_18920 [Pirellulaceae bacterium]|jgi:hypothetical protein|nr:hypothetical protein [Pirellulaceae bacterium]MDP7017885.1 hypothetical protein [Pirellulaceae bacterium]
MEFSNPLASFDPAKGHVVRKPPGEGVGYWVGAPGAFVDADGDALYLVYRLRRPRGEPLDRGAEIQIARSADGKSFETIWTATKDQLNSSSIERCALRKLADRRWLLYISYVDPADGRWRVDLVEAEEPTGFDLATARPIFTAADLDVDGVKDPYVIAADGRYWMLLSYADAIDESDDQRLHATHDAYNTGLIRSATGLATSDDGLQWRWEGEILGPGPPGWDQYCRRIGCLLPLEQGWLALYDGSASVEENYEERLGLAYSPDGFAYRVLSLDEPAANPPHGPAALRYFDGVEFQGEVRLFYEMATADGSHELRVASLEPNAAGAATE